MNKKAIIAALVTAAIAVAGSIMSFDLKGAVCGVPQSAEAAAVIQ